ncbi:MAG: Hypothetical protein BHV28_08690 [Candidatus Tokpelaia hoelldobleri]|uniref:SurA N-terminal domain-containing protein n=1 Tax=Candidatus Tokpelaia hoelldobleri TaxID=1902579 RepID=A0A1U9JUP4_9HYPH|nr:MAG: Hypothetical protein BHV28_08690 [Candidatus Tokpelaia hoelldoblerii]
MMTKLKNRLFAYALSALAAGLMTGNITLSPAMAASQVAVIVNGNAITNYDIQRRAAFLQLQGRGGGTKAAREDMVDEMLRRVEMKKRNISVTDGEVNRAFAGFAERNRMSEAQLSQMLNQAGVTADHFKTYIRTQMGWGRLLSARFQSEGGVTDQQVARHILQNGGIKPTSNEYMLQQVIFVIPQNRRGAITGRRTQEANSLRARINGCNSIRSTVNNAIANGMRDITVRNLGRNLELRLPPEWSSRVKATAAGKATTVRTTDRGVEFLVVCSRQKVSNDEVSRLVVGMEKDKKRDKQADALEKKYMKELRDNAQIKNP